MFVRRLLFNDLFRREFWLLVDRLWLAYLEEATGSFGVGVDRMLPYCDGLFSDSTFDWSYGFKLFGMSVIIVVIGIWLPVDVDGLINLVVSSISSSCTMLLSLTSTRCPSVVFWSCACCEFCCCCWCPMSSLSESSSDSSPGKTRRLHTGQDRLFFKSHSSIHFTWYASNG